MRIHAFHQCREALWALDVAWAGRPDHLVLSNFLRFFGGPIHMSTFDTPPHHTLHIPLLLCYANIVSAFQ